MLSSTVKIVMIIMMKDAEVLNAFVHSNFDNATMKSIMSGLHHAVCGSYKRTKAN